MANVSRQSPDSPNRTVRQLKQMSCKKNGFAFPKCFSPDPAQSMPNRAQDPPTAGARRQFLALHASARRLGFNATFRRYPRPCEQNRITLTMDHVPFFEPDHRRRARALARVRAPGRQGRLSGRGRRSRGGHESRPARDQRTARRSENQARGHQPASGISQGRRHFRQRPRSTGRCSVFFRGHRLPAHDHLDHAFEQNSQSRVARAVSEAIPRLAPTCWRARMSGWGWSFWGRCICGNRSLTSSSGACPRCWRSRANAARMWVCF